MTRTTFGLGPFSPSSFSTSSLFLLPSEAQEVNGPSWQGLRYGGGWEDMRPGNILWKAASKRPRGHGKIGYEGHRAFWGRPDLLLGHPDLVLSLTCLFFMALSLGSLKGHCPLVQGQGCSFSKKTAMTVEWLRICQCSFLFWILVFSKNVKQNGQCLMNCLQE